MKVRLSEYDQNWVHMFEDETRVLKEIFGEEIIKFEHFGSTSVEKNPLLLYNRPFINYQ